MDEEQVKRFFNKIKHVSKHNFNRISRLSRKIYKIRLKRVKALMPRVRMGDYIASHCRVYNDDSPDDPTLTPQGKHISYPVKDLETFRKYFKIIPRSDIGIVTKVNKNKKGE